MKMKVIDLKNRLRDFPKNTPVWTEHQSGFGQSTYFTGIVVENGKAYLGVDKGKNLKKVKHLLKSLENVDDSLPVVVCAFDSYFNKDSDDDFLLEYHVGGKRPFVVFKIPVFY